MQPSSNGPPRTITLKIVVRKMIERRLGLGEIVQEELSLRPPVSRLEIHWQKKKKKRLGRCVCLGEGRVSVILNGDLYMVWEICCDMLATRKKLIPRHTYKIYPVL